MRAFVECEVSMMVCRREQGEKQTNADFYVTMAWYRTPGSLTTVNLNMTFLVMMLGQQNIYPLMIRYHYVLLLNMKNMVCWSSFVLVPWAYLICSLLLPMELSLLIQPYIGKIGLASCPATLGRSHFIRAQKLHQWPAHMQFDRSISCWRVSGNFWVPSTSEGK